MIQRIQTLFLLLVVITAGLLFFFPIETNLDFPGLTDYYRLLVYELFIARPGSQPEHDYIITLPLLVANLCIIVLSIITIFKYRKRMLQMRLVKIAAFINILMVFGIFFGYSRIIEQRIDISSVTGNFAAGAFFPLVTLVLLVLAFRRIRHDENIVRSADRLR